MTDRFFDIERFRRDGYAAVDWVCEYLRTVESFPVLSRVSPGDVRRQLPPDPPEQGEPFENVLSDLNTVILPGITHWQSPGFFAFFPGNSSPPAVLGEILSAGLGVQGMLWVTSPACTELETHVMDWLVKMLGLPERFASTSAGGGVIQDSASSSTLCAILAARERATRGRGNREGAGGKLVAYASVHAHSSVEKDCMIAGIGADNLRLIEADDRHAMKPGALAEQVKRDREQGLTPFFVCATVGTTSSMGIDPVPAIGGICREHGLWLHVDAAMAGTAALCPEFRFLNAGLDLADSYVFNPHKWMFTNFDCSAFFVADRQALVSALSVVPEYLRNKASEEGAVIDYRDWQVPLGRRFRALKLWLVIRQYGVEGLRERVRHHVALGQEFKGWVQASKEFELAVDTPLNVICFRHRRGDAATEEVHRRVNASGEMYITHTKLDGRYTLRLCVGQTRTERRHVRRAWELLEEAGRDV
jgi:aromatic-L-amino-acid decarboxylase